jgi:hypothetical protein
MHKLARPNIIRPTSVTINTFGKPALSMDIITKFLLTLSVQSQFCASNTPSSRVHHPRLVHPSEKRPSAISLLQFSATTSRTSKPAPSAMPCISTYKSGVSFSIVREYAREISRTAAQSNFDVCWNIES